MQIAEIALVILVREKPSSSSTIYIEQKIHAKSNMLIFLKWIWLKF